MHACFIPGTCADFQFDIVGQTQDIRAILHHPDPGPWKGHAVDVHLKNGYRFFWDNLDKERNDTVSISRGQTLELYYENL